MTERNRTVRAQARASRYGLLLALLLLMIAVSAPVAHDVDDPNAGPDSLHPGLSVLVAVPVDLAPHDRPRGSATTGHASTTVAPDTWWVVLAHTAGANSLTAQGFPGGHDRSVPRAATATSRSSRAPPRVH